MEELWFTKFLSQLLQTKLTQALRFKHGEVNYVAYFMCMVHIIVNQGIFCYLISNTSVLKM